MEKRVTFPCSGIILEGLLSIPDPCATAVVVCHPHPAYGGEMHNNVVQALVDAFEDRGDATLRFNFRGTGASGGSHGGGAAELEDVVSAVDFLLAESRASRVAVAGYSCGDIVGMRAGMEDDRVSALAGIALPVGMMDGSFLLGCTKPKLLVAGDRDEFGPLPAVQELFDRIPEPKTMKVVSGADHFYIGLDSTAARHASAFLQDAWIR
jgi:alpha/beta superfamily hydrolase